MSFELRQYDPLIGRWISPDPYNQYHSSYVGMGNLPHTFVDPDGGKAGWLSNLFKGGGGRMVNGVRVYQAGTGAANAGLNAGVRIGLSGSAALMRNLGKQNELSGNLFGPPTAENAKKLYTSRVLYQRTTETENSTIGIFKVENTDIEGFILEPAGPSTTTPNQDRRIPAGRYKMVWHFSNNYNGVLKLYNKDVPKSRAILIHIGNYPEDTQGCLLPGASTGTDAIWNSGTKFNELIQHFQEIGLDWAEIIISDPPASTQ